MNNFERTITLESGQQIVARSTGGAGLDVFAQATAALMDEIEMLRARLAGASKPSCGILAGEPEIIGERCADGGKCHHQCSATCFRKECCGPLALSGLTDEWEAPAQQAGAPLPLAPSDREQFSAVMVANGWGAPATNGRGGAFLSGRDEDLYVGWVLTRATLPTGKYDNVLRPFLALMERELHSNSSKGDRPGWLAMSRDRALLEIYYHVSKLYVAMKNDDAAAIAEHAADVANMAMMALDVCGGLDHAR